MINNYDISRLSKCLWMSFFDSVCRTPERDVLSWNGHAQRPPPSQPRARRFRDGTRWHMEADPSQNLQLPDVQHTAPKPPGQQLPEASKAAEAHPSISAPSSQHTLPSGAAGPQWSASTPHFFWAPLQRLRSVRHRVQLCHGDGLRYPLAPSDEPARSVLQPCVVHQPHIRYLRSVRLLFCFVFYLKLNKNKPIIQ